MAKVITENGTVTEVTPENGKNFTLKELYKYTNCNCIDVVEIMGEEEGTYRDMVLNDNGMAENNPNLLATAYYIKGRDITEPELIFGDVLICETKEIE